MQSDCSNYNNDICRSCELIELKYTAQLEHKLSILKTELGSEIANKVQISPFAESERLLPSRNKAKLIVAGDSANPIIGITRENLRINELLNCPLQIDPINSILSNIKQLIRNKALNPYDITNKCGELKYLILRASESSRQCMLRFVLRSELLINKLSDLVPILQNQHPALKVITANIQPIAHSFNEGEKEIVLTKDSYIEEQLGRFNLTISPQSFSQVTSNVAEKLYQFVASRVAIIKPRLMFDLYSGIGCFSIFSAAYAEKILAVELSKSSFQDAKRSARLNLVDNVEFFEADCIEWLKSQTHKQPDLIVLNPPRRGLGREITEKLNELKAKVLIYSSCNPKTLASDLKILSSAYNIEIIQPFDMFPLTTHFETVIELKLRM